MKLLGPPKKRTLIQGSTLEPTFIEPVFHHRAQITDLTSDIKIEVFGVFGSTDKISRQSRLLGRIFVPLSPNYHDCYSQNPLHFLRHLSTLHQLNSKRAIRKIPLFWYEIFPAIYGTNRSKFHSGLPGLSSSGLARPSGFSGKTVGYVAFSMTIHLIADPLWCIAFSSPILPAGECEREGFVGREEPLSDLRSEILKIPINIRTDQLAWIFKRNILLNFYRDLRAWKRPHHSLSFGILLVWTSRRLHLFELPLLLSAFLWMFCQPSFPRQQKSSWKSMFFEDIKPHFFLEILFAVLFWYLNLYITLLWAAFGFFSFHALKLEAEKSEKYSPLIFVDHLENRESTKKEIPLTGPQTALRTAFKIGKYSQQIQRLISMMEKILLSLDPDGGDPLVTSCVKGSVTVIACFFSLLLYLLKDVESRTCFLFLSLWLFLVPQRINTRIYLFVTSESAKPWWFLPIYNRWKYISNSLMLMLASTCVELSMAERWHIDSSVRLRKIKYITNGLYVTSPAIR